MQNWLDIDEVVFARTSTDQKVMIVKSLQKLGHIVALTGDGVNDSPALKRSNIGISMVSGTDIAKDCSDMILLNDDFSSLLSGIEEGRKIHDNLKKTITYVLTSNFSEMIPFIVSFFLELPLPLTTVLILIIDVGTDLLPGISLSYEEPEYDILSKGPRHKYERLASFDVICYAYV